MHTRAFDTLPHRDDRTLGPVVLATLASPDFPQAPREAAGNTSAGH